MVIADIGVPTGFAAVRSSLDALVEAETVSRVEVAGRKVILYIDSLEQGRLPIALSMALSRKMQMAGWVYWRMYGVRFQKRAFLERFGTAFDGVYGRAATVLSALGLVRDDGSEITLTDAGAYWLHVVQDLFSLDAVGRLWAAAMADPWPRKVVL